MKHPTKWGSRELWEHGGNDYWRSEPVTEPRTFDDCMSDITRSMPGWNEKALRWLPWALVGSVLTMVGYAYAMAGV